MVPGGARFPAGTGGGGEPGRWRGGSRAGAAVTRSRLTGAGRERLGRGRGAAGGQGGAAAAPRPLLSAR